MEDFFLIKKTCIATSFSIYLLYYFGFNYSKLTSGASSAHATASNNSAFSKLNNDAIMFVGTLRMFVL